MIEFKVYNLEKQIGKFKYIVFRHRDGVRTASAICRNEREVRLAVERFSRKV